MSKILLLAGLAICTAVLLPATAQAQRSAEPPVRVLGASLSDSVTAASNRSAAAPGPDGQVLGRAAPEAASARRPNPDFLARQLAYPRVLTASVDAKFAMKSLFRSHELEYPPYEMFLRVFKQEKMLELWVRPSADAPFTLLKEYPICAMPGRMGPKRRAGDYQVPEGFYTIEAYNPLSEYYLSLRVNYPNRADRIRGDTAALGGDIFIHGGCQSVGCVPVEDAAMKEIYWLAVEAHAAGQASIPVHIFPTRMDAQGLAWLSSVFSPNPRLLEFWRSLQHGYDHFESTRLLPHVEVTPQGTYAITDDARPAPPPSDAASKLPSPTKPRSIGPPSGL